MNVQTSVLCIRESRVNGGRLNIERNKDGISTYHQIIKMDDDDSYANYGSNEYSEEVYGAVGGGSKPTSDPYGGIDAYSEEVRFENEYNVHERVGGYLQTNILGELGTTETEVDLRDPIQRFTQFTKTVAQEMVDQGVIGLKRPDIRYIIDQIQYIPNVKYKNPTAFVLGFWATTRDGTINRERLKRLTPSLKTLKYPVQDYDVLRYANLWIDTRLYNTD